MFEDTVIFITCNIYVKSKCDRFLMLTYNATADMKFRFDLTF